MFVYKNEFLALLCHLNQTFQPTKPLKYYKKYMYHFYPQFTHSVQDGYELLYTRMKTHKKVIFIQKEFKTHH